MNARFYVNYIFKRVLQGVKSILMNVKPIEKSIWNSNLDFNIVVEVELVNGTVVPVISTTVS